MLWFSWFRKYVGGFQFSRERLSQLIAAGMRRLQQHGHLDDLGRCVVHLRYGWCFGRVCAVDWGDPQADPADGLFFEGKVRTWWGAWEQLCDWQTPRDPDAVTPENCSLLRRVKEHRLKRVLKMVRHGRPISADEFSCSTLLGG